MAFGKNMNHKVYFPKLIKLNLVSNLIFEFGLICLSYSSLDSEFLASTSTDGSARIWKTEDGVPLMTLARNSVPFL